MTFRYIRYSLLLALLVPCYSQAQNIAGDTIMVSKENYGIVQFPGEVQGFELTTSRKKDYDITTKGKRITVKAGTKDPVSPCTILIDEGDKGEERSHRFVILFVDDNRKFESFHDLSTTDLIKDRMAYLEKHKNDPVSAPAPSPTPAEMLRAQNDNPQPAAKQPESDNRSLPSSVRTDGDSFTVGKLTISTKEFKDKVNKKRDNFRIYSERLGAHAAGYMNDIPKAFRLFNNDTTVIIQVTSKGLKDPVARKVKDYLERLSMIKFDHITITNSQVQFFSDLYQRPDGKYACHVSYIQHFEGFRGDRKAFQDDTKRSQEIILELFDTVDSGVTKPTYAVYLGNLTVDQTNK